MGCISVHESASIKSLISDVQPNATTPTTKSTPLPSKSLSASLPGLLRPPSTPQVGRPPTTVMTPEQIVEKAKQVRNRLRCQMSGYSHAVPVGGQCYAKDCGTSKGRSLV